MQIGFFSWQGGLLFDNNPTWLADCNPSGISVKLTISDGGQDDGRRALVVVSSLIDQAINQQSQSS